MHPVSRLAPVRPHARAGTTTTSSTRQAPPRGTAPTSRGRAWRPCRHVAPAPRLRARVTPGTTEPVEAREDNAEPPAAAVGGEAEAGLAPEELEVLEEAAIAGVDEGRRPTDYDRRAHIFEESSRVFRELKHQRDAGGMDGAAIDAGTGTRHQQQLG